MNNKIIKAWIKTTMVIENEFGGRATGFLVRRRVNPNTMNEGHTYLVTNKHVLAKNMKERHVAQHIRVHYNIVEPGKVKGEYADLPLSDSHGNLLWAEHKNDNIDVLAFDVTHLFVAIPEIFNWVIDYDDGLADSSILRTSNVTIGDDIFVIGYPLELRGSLSNFPIVRTGIIASRIGHEVIWGNQKLRAFFVDCAIFPGSSGSPVVLKPSFDDLIYGNDIDEPVSSILLGIISQVKLGPIAWKKNILPNYAHLGLAFNAETIKETIDLFYQ